METEIRLLTPPVGQDFVPGPVIPQYLAKSMNKMVTYPGMCD